MSGAPGLARNPSARARRAGSRGRKAEGAARKAFCLAARALRLVRKAKSLAPPAQSLVPKAACLAPRSQSLAGNAQSLAGKAKSLGCQGAEPCPQGFLPCAQGEQPRDACWVLWRRKAVSRPPGAAAQAGLRGASPRAAGAGRVCQPGRGANSPANPCPKKHRSHRQPRAVKGWARANTFAPACPPRSTMASRRVTPCGLTRPTATRRVTPCGLTRPTATSPQRGGSDGLSGITEPRLGVSSGLNGRRKAHLPSAFDRNSRLRKGTVPGKSPSEPPSSAATGGAFRRSCLSPQGEFCAGRPLRAAQGSRPQRGRPVKPGRLSCLLLWRSKEVSRPPGAEAGFRGASLRAAGAGRVCKPDRGTNSPANPCSSNARNEFSRVTRRAHVGRLKSPLKGRPMRESVSGGRSPFLTWGKRGGATP